MKRTDGSTKRSWVMGLVLCLAIVGSVFSGEVITDGLHVIQQGQFYGSVVLGAGIATNDLRLYYSLSTSTNFVDDESIYSHTGLVYQAAWTADGSAGGAYEFDGTDDYIQTPDETTLDITGPFTISVWARDWRTNTVQALVMKHDDGNQRAYATYVNSGRFECQISSDGTSAHLYDFRTPLIYASTGWTHIVFVWDGRQNAGGAIYINGSNTAIEVTYSAFAGTNIYNSSMPLRVGAKSNTGWFYDGTIDEVRIYARALSGAEIAELYFSCDPGYDATNAYLSVGCPAYIKHLVPQGDIGMGSYTNEP